MELEHIHCYYLFAKKNQNKINKNKQTKTSNQGLLLKKDPQNQAKSSKQKIHKLWIAMQMLKCCIKTHLIQQENFELSAKNMLLKFLICVFKADKYQTLKRKGT